MKQRLIVDAEDRPLVIEEVVDGEDTLVPLPLSPQRAGNRAFWSRFIASVRFDHPDQTPPVHGGNNWVKIAMPFPGRWITAYRETTDVGLYLVNERSDALESLPLEISDLRTETGLPDLTFWTTSKHGPGTAGITRPRSSFADEQAQLLWLTDTANRLVNAFRPRLARLGAEQDRA